MLQHRSRVDKHMKAPGEHKDGLQSRRLSKMWRFGPSGRFQTPRMVGLSRRKLIISVISGFRHPRPSLPPLWVVRPGGCIISVERTNKTNSPLPCRNLSKQVLQVCVDVQGIVESLSGSRSSHHV